MDHMERFFATIDRETVDRPASGVDAQNLLVLGSPAQIREKVYELRLLLRH